MMNSVKEELSEICRTHGGVLRPKDVVDFARDPGSKLHEKFDWDDSSAAEKYRLEQARMIIRFEVRVVDEKKVPVYFSFSDRRRDGESYRAVVDILADNDLREKMLEQALREAVAWAERYERFRELAGIVRAIRKVSKNGTGRKSRRSVGLGKSR